MSKYKDGTAVAGFVTASENKPPRECGNCRWFSGKDSCEHPVMEADPETLKHEDGKAAVDSDDCCDYFQNKRKR